MTRAFVFLSAIALFAVAPARADELKLKDGSTIVGTIVAYEENSFKVQTSYGFAVVQKDQVVEIHIGDSPKKNVGNKNSSSAGAGPLATLNSAKPASSAASPPANNAEPVSPAPTAPMQNLQASAAAPAVPITSSPKRSAIMNAPVVVKAMARSLAVPTFPVTVAEPPKPAPPEPMREEVSGNLYRNETFGFRMYKPPDWDLILDARALLPGSITAMGTYDETTYLLVGQEPAGKSLAADIDATEHRLSNIMDNFRATGESRIMVSGTSAIERRFRGRSTNASGPALSCSCRETGRYSQFSG